MNSLLEYLFGAASFVPHGYCLLWRPDLVALHAISDALIAIAYFSIPLGLWYFVRQKPDIGFRQLFVLFAVFILFCGLTHAVGLITLWAPVYGLLGLIKAATAIVSLIAAYLLWPAIPRALAIPGLDALRSANLEVGRAIVERQELVSGLNAANRDLDDFLNTVAHDLRSPLRCINGFSQILLEDYADKIDARGQEMLERMRKATLNMGQLFDSLLFLSRLRHTPLHKVDTDLSGMARQVTEELRREFPHHSPEVLIQDGLRAECDPNLMYIALRHLMHNAWKFSSKTPEPHIEFSWSRADGHSRIVLRDNGIGFDMAQHDRIFGLFHRLVGQEKYEGTGAGLAIVRKVADKIGARVWADATPGSGATFHLALPDQESTRDARA